MRQPATMTTMWNRRELIRLAAITAAASTLGATSSPKPSAPAQRGPVKPKRLSVGDTVGLILPASAVYESDHLAIAKEQMEAIGFKVKVGEHALDRFGYFAGRDRDRAA